MNMSICPENNATANSEDQTAESTSKEPIKEMVLRKFLLRELARIEDEARDPSQSTRPSGIGRATNPDESMVTLDAQGRVTGLFDKNGNEVHGFWYRTSTCRQPQSISMADGMTIEKLLLVGSEGRVSTAWVMKSADRSMTIEYLDSTLDVRKDGSFAIRYSASNKAQTRGVETVREAVFTAHGVKHAEFERKTVMRIGPKNTSHKLEALVRRVEQTPPKRALSD